MSYCNHTLIREIHSVQLCRKYFKAITIVKICILTYIPGYVWIYELFVFYDYFFMKTCAFLHCKKFLHFCAGKCNLRNKNIYIRSCTECIFSCKQYVLKLTERKTQCIFCCPENMKSTAHAPIMLKNQFNVKINISQSTFN